MGVFGAIGPRVLSAFEDGLSFDQIRGPHSTGVAIVESGTYQVDVIKDTVLPHKLYRDPRWAPLTGRKNLALIGHNRFATVGKQVKENAHPFQRGTVTLAHNGTIAAFDRKHLPNNEDFEVDSDNIAHAIDILGIEETWKLIDGAATLVYFDSHDKTLNFISNCQRPFVYSWVSGGAAIAWCSESELLKAAIQRNGLVTSTKQDQYGLAKDRLVSFKIGRKGGISFFTTDLQPFQRADFLHPHNTRRTQVLRKGKYYWKDTGEEVDDDGSPWQRHFTELDAVNASALTTPEVGTSGASPTIPVELKVITRGSTGEKETSGTKGASLNSKNFTKEEFEHTFKKCCFCNLENLDYETATVMDRRTAACESCAEEAAIHNIRCCS